MKYFLLLSILFLSLGLNAQITPAQAKDSIGKTLSVCGLVDDTHAAPGGTFLNMGGQYPNHVFTAVIFKEYLGKFTIDLVALKGKHICVYGKVEMYKSKPQIIVRSPKQIEVK